MTKMQSIRWLLAFGVLIVCSRVDAAQQDDEQGGYDDGANVVVRAGNRNMVFTNPIGTFVLLNNGGVYDYISSANNQRQSGQLSYIKTIGLKLDRGEIDEIEVYQLGKRNIWIGISTSSYKLDGNAKKLRYRLYFTNDLKRYTRWKAPGGTRGVKLTGIKDEVEDDNK